MQPHFQCRSCGSDQGSLILDLGQQPLANNLLRPEDLEKLEPRFPLRLAVCQSCWLLQILDLVPPVDLFSEYLYFSSFSDAMVRHAREATERYIAEFALNESSWVVEIASNDGYLLKNFNQHRIPSTGIEPAANIAQAAQKNGIDTLVEFFNLQQAQKLVQSRRHADLILGNNVFAHVPDTNDFVAGLRALLKPLGRIVLEFPYAREMIEKSEFDTIYHEHVFYFTLTALRPLFERHGLTIFRVESLGIHGGSLRLFACHRGDFPVEASVTNLLRTESNDGLANLAYYENFNQKAVEIKRSLTLLLDELISQGKSLAAYGASAKGSTLLNFVALRPDYFRFVADRSPYKQGRFTPGLHIPIVKPEVLALERPDYTLLLTWNFADEILNQQQAYRAAGGKFIIPIPKVMVL